MNTDELDRERGRLEQQTELLKSLKDHPGYKFIESALHKKIEEQQFPLDIVTIEELNYYKGFLKGLMFIADTMQAPEDLLRIANRKWIHYQQQTARFAEVELSPIIK